jgi:NAD(P)-dependent dehydrogenase (short-subunit alcohol dehydrogenase family)
MANWFATQPNQVMAGKTAVVMGGGSGIGKATAEALVAAGANVMICGVPEQLCLDAAEELKAQATTGGVAGMFCDGTSQDSLDAMFAKTVELFGTVDYAISTAGIALPRTNALEITSDQYDKIFAVNVKANWFFATTAGKIMRDKNGDKGGKIVLVSSGRGDRAMENIAPYSTTKSAVMGMIRALAVDLAKFNITVNGIAPGYVMTPMVKKVFEEQPQQEAYVKSRTPMRDFVYMGSLDEMASAIMFFLNPINTYTTGQYITLDGGWSAQ